MAVMIAGISVIVSPSICRKGIRPFGLKWRNSAGNPCMTSMILVEKRSPDSWRSMWTAVLQEPGEWNNRSSFGVIMMDWCLSQRITDICMGINDCEYVSMKDYGAFIL